MAWGALVQRFFGTKGSKDEAKGRLQVVLAYERLGLSADQLETLRKDILETINRHISIDTDRVKIDFLQQNPTAVKIEAPVRAKRPAGEETKSAEPVEQTEVEEPKLAANEKQKRSVG